MLSTCTFVVAGSTNTNTKPAATPCNSTLQTVH